LDGVTDPIVGWFIDRTKGRCGKFRPFMAAGNAVMALSVLLMYLCQGLNAWRLPMFIAAYTVYIVGYTCQFCITRAAQSVLTNDPKQRPVFSAFDMVMNVILYVGITMMVSNYLIPAHGGFNRSMFGELFLYTVIASGACTVLAIIGIWRKDRAEYYVMTENTPKARLRDCWEIVRGNGNVRMLMICSGTDKLFSNITMNAVVTIIIFGVIAGDFALLGQTNMIVFGPSMAVSLLCVQFARKKGLKEALLFSTYGGIVFTVLLFLLFVLGNPAALSYTNWGVFTILFVIFLALRGGFMSINNSIIVPMVADCVDHEAIRSQRYVPGMTGALFSLVDKVVLSLNTVIVGGLVILAGFKEQFPAIDTPYSPALFWVGMICFCGLPLLSWIINIICLKYYSLSRDGMVEIQHKINNVKSAAAGISRVTPQR